MDSGVLASGGLGADEVEGHRQMVGGGITELLAEARGGALIGVGVESVVFGVWYMGARFNEGPVDLVVGDIVTV